ncbi:hypothetical protein [Laspinema olomoucense]|uniref:hypothetical protein n=1 Tax=Laspinema olomoucense TaxID=3231600 RepID=UPI0021BAAEF8|nr:hypothetical protein [Laspinema sp. D3d]MCT7973983.1 hypothetical protein [Laspinema sp. D3d]
MNKSRKNQNNESLALLSVSIYDLGMELPNSSNSLNCLEISVLTRIKNAWSKGTIVDRKTGKIWIRRDNLAIILQTDKNIANFIFGGADATDKTTRIINDNGEQKSVPCLSAEEVSKQLSKMISTPSSMTQREYGKFSWEILTFIKHSPEIDKIISLHIEKVNSQLPKLKKERIKHFNLIADELTGERFHSDSRRIHFSHIRGKRTYVGLALDFNNGLVVNEETHKIITKEGVQDEKGLFKICQKYSWNTSWYQPYLQRFGD